MFTRATGLVIVPFWLTAMAWLVAHDVLPGLTADDPPKLRATEWLEREGKESQYAIFGESGRLGTIWTRYLLEGFAIQRQDLIWIEEFPVDIAPLRMSVNSSFTPEGLLDEFTLRAHNAYANMRLHGERFHADFSFSFQLGSIDRTFTVPLTDGGMIAGAFHPFSQLTDLHLGQRWRMQVFNPVAALTGLGPRFLPWVVEVTGQERIHVGDRAMDCLIVEGPNTRAWVDPRGVVQAQELTLPVAGKLRIVRESSYDAELRDRVRQLPFLGR